ncbi:MAG: H-type lectin domain-containing protein [Ignavibacteriaceae bacterium]|nr:H-type lectin domain-containing protein [Ignavibacterium sp.]MCC6253727.1 H-type lectin domain-containing protein [Ignavibacteriaceae bacterium]HMN24366.1 H-type lectin domain-containing protein [Ignavibacteriaceae bacterium]HRN26365.1 H-type lectin domain-containing protein [Ignavibacteriaceae bacterium]HRP91502.1 H-type lectin domain-containing protein [Ignavibacteriaceae bacterium]
MKNFYLLFTISIFLLITLSVDAQTIQSSSWSVNQSLAAYSLDKNNGERMMTIVVKFDKPFTKKPQVILSVTQIDSDKEANTRYNVEAISVSRDGFTLKVRTWADSRLFSISGYWVAFAD